MIYGVYFVHVVWAPGRCIHKARQTLKVLGLHGHV